VGSDELILVQQVFWYLSNHAPAQFMPVQTNFHPSKGQEDGWLAKGLIQMCSTSSLGCNRFFG